MIALVAAAFAGTLTGSIVGDDGAGVQGITVVAYDLRLNYGNTRTGTDGTWSIGSLPAGRYRVRALADDDDPHVDRFGGDTWDFCAAPLIEVPDGGSADAGTTTLPTGGSLSGQVLDAGGQPVGGATVVAVGASARTSLVTRLVTADDQGRYTVPGLDSDPGSPEPYFVYVAATGWPGQYLGPTYDEDEADTVDVTIGEGATAPDFSLLDGISVTGTITGPDGPVPGATVYAYASSQVLDTVADAEGVYVADGLPPGDVLVWASGDGLATTYWPGEDRPTDARVDGNTEGMLVDGVDLALPVESRLTLDFDGDGPLDDVSVLLYNTDYTVGRGGGLNPDGMLEIDGLFDGDYTLYVFGDDGGFVRDWLRDDTGAVATIHVEGDTLVTATLDRAGTFEGRVVDDQGVPVYGAAIYAFATDGDETVSAVTDHDGNYALEGLFAGRWRVRASYTNYCAADPGYVTVWWDGALEEDAAGSREVALGETVTGMDFTLPNDDDHDAMGDAWEADNGLDPTRDDAAEDADGDGFANIDEYLAGTDPTDESVAKKCGCGSGSAAWVLPLALLQVRRRRTAQTGARRAIAFRW